MKYNILTAILSSTLLVVSCDTNLEPKEIISTYEDGTSKTEIIWFIKNDSTFRQIGYYDNGQIWTDELYLDGKLQKLKTFHKTGEISGLLFFENDKYVAGSEYYKNGQKMGDVPKEINGGIHGLIRYYYENGYLRADGEYRNGKKTGIWRDYDQDGVVTDKREFVNGQEVK